MEYIANLMEKFIRQSGENKYGRKLIELPVPRLVVFYNGQEDQPDARVLRLTDAFKPELRARSDIEVTVHMLNINMGHNEQLLSDCPPLGEYAWVVDSVRHLKAGNTLETAIDKTINQMPKDFLIRPFLEAHQAEVKNMLLTEYNEAETMELFREEGRAEGRAEGRENERIASIRNLMQTLKLSACDAMNALKIPVMDQERYLQQL